MPGRAPMPAPGSTTLLTAEDLLALPNPKLPHELWRGVLHLAMPASPTHGSSIAWGLIPAPPISQTPRVADLKNDPWFPPGLKPRALKFQ